MYDYATLDYLRKEISWTERFLSGDPEAVQQAKDMRVTREAAQSLLDGLQRQHDEVASYLGEL